MQFERTANNTIRFTDTDGIDWNTWHKTFLIYRHLGYGFHDENDVKRYFNRGTPLQKDQADAFLQIIGEAHRTDTYSKDVIEKDNDAARKFYGETITFRKAGFMMTDGTMLDLSEGQWQRTLDHRSIINIFDDRFEEQVDAMYRFMAYGNIRLLSCGFDLILPPTDAQWRMLKDFVFSRKSIYVDISNENGTTVKHIEYETVTPLTFSRIKAEVTEYFDAISI